MVRKVISIICTACICLSSVNFTSSGDISASAAVSAFWPVDAKFSEISTYFDPNRNYGGGGHNAIDIPADYSARIYAPVGGECVSAGWMGDYGNLIILRHDDLGVYTFYAHCSAVDVYQGQYVSAGSVIGYVGNTGNSYGNHLHFGVCDSLLNGWPTVTYYDPLTYFSYGGASSPEPSVPAVDSCSCTTDYAGTYTTKNISTYLNIRCGHGTEYSPIGKIYKGDQVTVTKSDGHWAHVECGGISGYCSMDYLTPAEGGSSGMDLLGARVPDGQIPFGIPYSIGGVINSNLPITRVTGGIYMADAATPVYVCEEYPYMRTYDLSVTFDDKLLFNKLDCGTYVYKIEAEDTSGEIYPLVGKSFMVTANDKAVGDLNGDGGITVDDGMLLENYILGIETLTPEQLQFADLTGDSVVDIYDIIVLRKMLSQAQGA